MIASPFPMHEVEANARKNILKKLNRLYARLKAEMFPLGNVRANPFLTPAKVEEKVDEIVGKMENLSITPLTLIEEEEESICFVCLKMKPLEDLGCGHFVHAKCKAKIKRNKILKCYCGFAFCVEIKANKEKNVRNLLASIQDKLYRRTYTVEELTEVNDFLNF